MSRNIIDALRLTLSPEEAKRSSERPITDMRAYECYLMARHEMWHLSEDSLTRALDLIERGIRTVGDNDQLHALKAMSFVNLVNTLSKPPETFASLLEQAQQSAAKALAINPTSAHAHYSQGYVFHQSCNPRESTRHMKRAVELDPNHADAFVLLGYQLAAGGRNVAEARGMLEKVMVLDPLTPMHHGAKGFLRIFEGDFLAAIDGWGEWRQSLEDENAPFLTWFAWFYAASGDFDEAFRVIDRVMRDSPVHVMAEIASFLKHAWRGQRQLALDVITERLEKAAWWDDLYSLWVAEGYACIGERDQAFHWLGHAIDYGIANERFLTEYDPLLKPLRSDARFKTLIEKANRVSDSLVV